MIPIRFCGILYDIVYNMDTDIANDDDIPDMICPIS